VNDLVSANWWAESKEDLNKTHKGSDGDTHELEITLIFVNESKGMTHEKSIKPSAPLRSLFTDYSILTLTVASRCDHCVFLSKERLYVFLRTHVESL
jgi:hypothetical protein